MWPLCVAASSGLVLPAASGSAPASIAASPLRVAAHPLLQAPPAVYSPSKDLAGRGAKYYDGRPPELSQSIAQALKEVGKRKICVITGASSGLGLHAVTALTSSYEGYYVIAAVRDTAKMDEAAAEMGIDAKDYKAVKLECASLASVRDFSKELKRLLRGRGLDRLVCNAAVYLPTDPKPRFTDEGYEMSFGVNHLSHFLLLQLLMPDLKKAKDARVCIVGSVAAARQQAAALVGGASRPPRCGQVTGNKNTVAGSLVKPVADVGDLEGVKAGAGSVMVDGSRSFDGAKAYKDAKARPREGGTGGRRGGGEGASSHTVLLRGQALNMMTVLEAHRRLHPSTGAPPRAAPSGGGMGGGGGLTRPGRSPARRHRLQLDVPGLHRPDSALP